jgi:hypothetical protein
LFEFQIVHANGLVGESTLNELGKQRWSLVTVVPDPDTSSGNGYFYIFQRIIMPTGMVVPGIIPRPNIPPVPFEKLDEVFNVH